MKKILIAFNLILLGIVVMTTFNTLSKSKDIAVEKEKDPVAEQKEETNVDTEETAAILLPMEEAVGKIVEKDVFNQVRSPLAYTRVGREDMTLVGVFQMGDVVGAIIKTNARQQQFNPFLAHAMHAAGEMNGTPAQQQPGRRFTQWSQMSGRTVPARQYVRLGDTMHNGYTLAEVSRGRVLLVRGNDKLELELQDPSKARAAASAPRPPGLNATQQFQQAQMFLQSQMIRTMRELSEGGGRQGGRGRR